MKKFFFLFSAVCICAVLAIRLSAQSCAQMSVQLLPKSGSPTDQCCYDVKLTRSALAPALSKLQINTSPPTIVSVVGGTGYNAVTLPGQPAVFSKQGGMIPVGTDMSIGSVCLRKPQTLDHLTVDFIDANDLLICSQPMYTTNGCNAYGAASVGNIDDLSLVCKPNTSPQEYTMSFTLYNLGNHIGSTVLFYLPLSPNAIVTPTSGVVSSSFQTFSLTLKNFATSDTMPMFSYAIPTNMATGVLGTGNRISLNRPKCNVPPATSPCTPFPITFLPLQGVLNSVVMNSGSYSIGAGAPKVKSISAAIINPQIKPGGCGSIVSNRPWSNVAAKAVVSTATLANQQNTTGSSGFSGFPNSPMSSTGNVFTQTAVTPQTLVVHDFIVYAILPPPIALGPNPTPAQVTTYISQGCKDTVRYTIQYTIIDEFGCATTKSYPVKFARNWQQGITGWSPAWGSGYLTSVEKKGGEVQAVTPVGISAQQLTNNTAKVTINYSDDDLKNSTLFAPIKLGFMDGPNSIVSAVSSVGKELIIRDGMTFVDVLQNTDSLRSVVVDYTIATSKDIGTGSFDTDMLALNLFYHPRGTPEGSLVESEPFFVHIARTDNGGVTPDKIENDNTSTKPTGVKTFMLSIANSSGTEMTGFSLEPIAGLELLAYGPPSIQNSSSPIVFDIEQAVFAGNKYEVSVRRGQRITGIESKGNPVQGDNGSREMGLPNGSVLRPFYLTVSNASAGGEIKFTTLSAGGDALTRGTIVLTSPISKVDVDGDEGTALLTSPNPANESAILSFELAQEREVSIEIVNSMGQTVRVLAKETPMSQGSHLLAIDTSSLPSGSYVVQVRAAGFVQSSSFIVVH